MSAGHHTGFIVGESEQVCIVSKVALYNVTLGVGIDPSLIG